MLASFDIDCLFYYYYFLFCLNIIPGSERERDVSENFIINHQPVIGLRRRATHLRQDQISTHSEGQKLLPSWYRVGWFISKINLYYKLPHTGLVSKKKHTWDRTRQKYLIFEIGVKKKYVKYDRFFPQIYTFLYFLNLKSC